MSGYADSAAGYDPETDEEVCGGIAPDDCCGVCPDCRDADDDWRETYAD